MIINIKEDILNIKEYIVINYLFHQSIGILSLCDAPNPEGPLTTRQPAEYLCLIL